MAKVKSVEEIIEDGNTYVVTTYTNGSVVKELKCDPPDIPNNVGEILTAEQQAIYETRVGVEYLESLAELNTTV